MGFIDFMSSFAQDLAKQAEKNKQQQEAQAMEKTKQIYRNGGTCFGCVYCNNTNFCDNTSSPIYDKQTYAAREKYGVPVCPHWRKR